MDCRPAAETLGLRRGRWWVGGNEWRTAAADTVEEDEVWFGTSGWRWWTRDAAGVTNCGWACLEMFGRFDYM